MQQASQPFPAAEVPSWLQNLTAAMATAAAAAAAAAAPIANNSGAHTQQQKKLGRTSRRQQLVTETAGRSPQGGEETSSDEDWLPDQTTSMPANKQAQVQKVVYKVSETHGLSSGLVAALLENLPKAANKDC
jgi:hypothetical protein